MLAIERRQNIMSLIREKKSVRVHELAIIYDVTEETIRRDLDKLDKEGKIKKTYGGAVLENPVSEDSSFIDRLEVNMDKKKAIGMKAAELIEDGETIFIDMSTTSLEVIKAVDPSKQITVITNSLEAIIVLGKKSNVRLITIGGTYDQNNQFMGGAMSHMFIDYYYADKTFFSVKGITMDRDFMDSKEDVAEIKAKMVKNSKEAILVADASKFEKSALVRVIDPNSVAAIVTDYELDTAWVEYFDTKDIRTVSVK